MKNFNTLVKQLLLNENPMFFEKILPIDLNDESKNEEIVKICFENGEKLNSFEGVEVYENMIDQKYSYFCFIKNNLADAYVEFSIDADGGMISKTVAQRKSKDTKGFLRRVFLNYFSQFFSSVTLDQVANTRGKEFFRKLLKESNEKGFRTTVLNNRTKEETPYVEDDFEKYWVGQSHIKDKKPNPTNLVFKIYFQ
jgi:hypothetical protein